MEPKDWYSSPCDATHYLTISQPETCAQADHIPCNQPSLIWLLKVLYQNPLGSLRFFRAWATCLLPWPSNNPFSAPNSDFSLCPVSLCIRHRNLYEVLWLSRDKASGNTSDQHFFSNRLELKSNYLKLNHTGAFYIIFAYFYYIVFSMW